MFKLLHSISCRSRSTAKNIICCNLATVPKNSFQLRILDYFEDTLKTQKSSSQYELPKYNTGCFSVIDKSDPEIRLQIEEKIETVKNEIKELSDVHDAELKKEKLNELETKCFTMINSLKPKDILSLLNEFYRIISYKLTTIYFYETSLSLLFQATENGLLNDHEKIQFLFFLSLKDKNVDDVNHLKFYLPDISDLSLIEKCIAAQSYYKTSIKLEEHELKPFEEVIEKNVKELIADPNLLVSLCRIVMMNNASNKLCLKHLSKTVTELKEPLDFRSSATILSLYAETLLFEPNAVHRLVKDAIQMIKKDISEKKYVYSLSLRDIDMFLWSISYLGITITLEEKLVLRDCIEKRFQEYKNNDEIPLSTLVNTILCLHMLRCWSTKIIKNCFENRIFSPLVHNKRVPWKVQARLQLLITQISLEMKMNCPNDLQKRINVGYTPSVRVNTVAQVASTLVDRGIIKSAILECPIDAIKIPGVTMFTENSIYHIDVLDNTTCLRDTNIPHGLTNLKLRLLSRLRYRQILINGVTFKEDPVKVEFALNQQIVKSVKYGKAARFIEDTVI